MFLRAGLEMAVNVLLSMKLSKAESSSHPTQKKKKKIEKIANWSLTYRVIANQNKI